MEQSLFFDLIKSKSLIAAIEQQNYKLSEKEILYLIKNYQSDFNKKCNLLNYFINNCDGKNEKDTAKQLLEHYKKAYDVFISDEDDCIYNIVIQAHSSDYENRLFTNTYTGALNAIKESVDCYEIEETENCRYSITKCRLTDTSFSYADDMGIAWATLGKGFKLLDVDCDTEGYCDFINEKINDVDFNLPCFLDDVTPVCYYNFFGEKKYGAAIKKFSDDFSAYVILFDSPIFRYDRVDEFDNSHMHLEYFNIDKINVSSLSDKNRIYFDKLVKAIENQSTDSGE